MTVTDSARERTSGRTRDAWLEDVMTRWEARLLRLCFAYLGDRGMAEDALQETFLKAWKGYERFRGEADEQTWLTRIAINTCKDVRRSAWFRRVDRSRALEELPEGSVPFEAADETLTLAVMNLPPRLREVALLHWLEDMTGEETAQALGISRSTVYARLEKAQAILRREWEG